MSVRQTRLRCEYRDRPAVLELAFDTSPRGSAPLRVTVSGAVTLPIMFEAAVDREVISEFEREVAAMVDALDGHAMLFESDGVMILELRTIDRRRPWFEARGGQHWVAFGSGRGGAAADPLGPGLCVSISDMLFERDALEDFARELAGLCAELRASDTADSPVEYD